LCRCGQFASEWRNRAAQTGVRCRQGIKHSLLAFAARDDDSLDINCFGSHRCARGKRFCTTHTNEHRANFQHRARRHFRLVARAGIRIDKYVKSMHRRITDVIGNIDQRMTDAFRSLDRVLKRVVDLVGSVDRMQQCTDKAIA
jgi:hypothetical protein